MPYDAHTDTYRGMDKIYAITYELEHAIQHVRRTQRGLNHYNNKTFN